MMLDFQAVRDGQTNLAEANRWSRRFLSRIAGSYKLSETRRCHAGGYEKSCR